MAEGGFAGGLMTGVGLGVIISLRDAFTRQAARIGASASALDAKIAGTAARINASMRLMTGGLVMAGAGIAALKFGDALVRQTEGIEEGVRQLRIKGFSRAEADAVRAQTLALASELGVVPQAAIEAALRTTEYGITSAREAGEALRATFRAAIGTTTDAVVATDGLLMVMKALDRSVSDLPTLSGKMQIGAGNMRISFGELAQQFPAAIPVMKLYNLELDDTLAYLTVMKQSGMEVGQAIGGLRMGFMQLQAPTDQMRTKLGALRGGQILAAIETNRMGDALKMLGEEMAGLSSGGRAAFLRNIGLGGRSASAINILLEQGPQVRAMLDQLGDAAAREQRSFVEMFENYGHQMTLMGVRLKNIWISLGEAVKRSNAGFITVINDILLKMDSFLRANTTIVNAVIVPTRAIARLAIAAGLTAAGIGLLRIALIKFNVAGAGGAGTLKLLQLGFSSILKTMGPLLLAFAAVTLAVKMFQSAYSTNFMGFADKIDRMIRKIGKLSEALNYAFGKGKGKIPVELGVELRQLGIYDFTKGIANLVAQLMLFKQEFGKGFLDAFQSDTFTKSFGVLNDMIATNISELFGGGMSIPYWGRTIGGGLGGMVASMVLGIWTIVAVMSQIAVWVKLLYDNIPAIPRRRYIWTAKNAQEPMSPAELLPHGGEMPTAVGSATRMITLIPGPSSASVMATQEAARQTVQANRELRLSVDALNEKFDQLPKEGATRKIRLVVGTRGFDGVLYDVAAASARNGGGIRQ